MFYNNAYPLNSKPQFGPSDIVDFEVKMRPMRTYLANSFRVSGYLQVSKQLNDGTVVPIVKEDNVFVNPYCGVHSFFRNAATSCNGSMIENISYYPVWAGMQKQKAYTLEKLSTSSDCLTELCGTQSNILLLGTNTADGVAFSFKPAAAINGSTSNLPQSRFESVRIVFNLASPSEALYTTHKEGSDYMLSADGFRSLTYAITYLQSAWYEAPEMPVPSPVVFNTCNLVTTTLLTGYGVFAVTSPNLYDAMSIRFIQQAHRNSLFFDNNLSEFIPGLEGGTAKTEVVINGSSAVVSFPIQSYADIARNYLKSLNGGVLNSITNAYLSKTSSFGLGFKFAVAANDRIAISVQIDPTQYDPSQKPCDVFQYLAGFAQV
jgi:hypothetical protein